MIKMKEKSVRASSKGIGLKLIETAKDRVVRVTVKDREAKVTAKDREARVTAKDHVVRVIETGREVKVAVKTGSMLSALIILMNWCGT